MKQSVEKRAPRGAARNHQISALGEVTDLLTAGDSNIGHVMIL